MELDVICKTLKRVTYYFSKNLIVTIPSLGRAARVQPSQAVDSAKSADVDLSLSAVKELFVAAANEVFLEKPIAGKLPQLMPDMFLLIKAIDHLRQQGANFDDMRWLVAHLERLAR